MSRSQENKRELTERLFEFAVNVILYLRTVKTTAENYDLKRQLTRSSSSGGANYEEAQGFVSKADSRVKIGISLKEVREANYFLKIFSRLKLGDTQKCQELLTESEELKRILSSIFNKLS